MYISARDLYPPFFGLRHYRRRAAPGFSLASWYKPTPPSRVVSVLARSPAGGQGCTRRSLRPASRNPRIEPPASQWYDRRLRRQRPDLREPITCDARIVAVTANGHIGGERP